MGWIISFLAIGVVALGAAYDRRRQRERSSLSRSQMQRWEDEGGALPTGPPSPARPD